MQNGASDAAASLHEQLGQLGTIGIAALVPACALPARAVGREFAQQFYAGFVGSVLRDQFGEAIAAAAVAAQNMKLPILKHRANACPSAALSHLSPERQPCIGASMQLIRNHSGAAFP
jgi:hypothetical protein